MADEIKISTSQLYKNLFVRFWRLLIQPAKEWASIKSEDKSFNEVLSDFALPLMGLSTVATFVGFVINHQGFNAELSMKHATLVFVSLFGGLYLVFFIMGLILSIKGLRRREVMALATYSSSLWYVVTFIIAVIPELVGIYLIIFYSIYIIHIGVEQYMAQTNRGYQIFMTLLLFLLVHLTPFIIKFTLLKFITL
ncbi:MAG TPA: hypothetical protein VKY45_13215 [Marinilabiliaceae bacterium]|nr:hypothetical protein [Marinilabiliaceae bacterium]